jgi:glycosyltransferase involved in cell wall biosynthesis
MARVIFLNRFYWPDEPATAQLLTDLAERLAVRGHAITVITSHPGGSKVPRTETHHGVQIVRLGRGRRGQSGLAGKAVDWGAFLFAATWRLWKEARRGDIVVAMTDPPLLAIGAWLAAALRGARLFHWVQDIYPELAIELTRHGWLAALRPLRNLAWRRADGCVTLGADMAATLAANGVAAGKISVVPNWAPAGLTPTPASAAAALRTEWGLVDKFVVAYSGNLGRVHDLVPVLALADALRAESRIAFLFVGTGAQRAALESEAARRGLANVQFRPPQPRAQLAASLAVGDLHLVTLLPGCARYVFPSKLYGVAAVSRPVVFIGPRDCELARLVADRDLGVAFERTDIAALADAVRALAGDAARCHRHALAAARFAADAGGADAAATRWSERLAASGLADNARA